MPGTRFAATANAEACQKDGEQRNYTFSPLDIGQTANVTDSEYEKITNDTVVNREKAAACYAQSRATFASTSRSDRLALCHDEIDALEGTDIRQRIATYANDVGAFSDFDGADFRCQA